jgi:hypothetical protein
MVGVPKNIAHATIALLIDLGKRPGGFILQSDDGFRENLDFSFDGRLCLLVG